MEGGGRGGGKAGKGGGGGEGGYLRTYLRPLGRGRKAGQRELAEEHRGRLQVDPLMLTAHHHGPKRGVLDLRGREEGKRGRDGGGEGGQGVRDTA